jgi:hypothetical protein
VALFFFWWYEREKEGIHGRFEKIEDKYSAAWASVGFFLLDTYVHTHARISKTRGLASSITTLFFSIGAGFLSFRSMHDL